MGLAGASVVRTIENDGPVYVAATGDDTNGAGTEASPFQTISKALTMLGTSTDIKVNYDANAQASDTLFSANGWTASQTVTLEGVADTTSGDYPTISVGTAQTGTAVQVSGVQTGTVEVTIKKLIFSYTLTSEDYSQSLFTVKNYDAGQVTSRANTNGDATLALEDVTVTSSAGTGAVKASTIAATSGSVSLKTVSFTDISLTGKALLDIASGVTLTLGEDSKAVEFTGITRTDAEHGAVLEATIDDDASLDLSYAVFSGCGTTSATDGAIGAALKITLSEAGGTLTLGTVADVFPDTSTQLTTTKTYAVIFVAANTDLLFKDKDTDGETAIGYNLGTVLTDMSTANKYYGIVGTSGSETKKDLYKLAESPSETAIYVAATGDDTNGAGTEASPFKTISKALTELTAGTDIKVKYDASAQASNTLFAAGGWTASQTVTLEGQSNGATPAVYPTITVGSDQSQTPVKVTGVSDAEITVTVKNLVFQYSISAAYDQSLFTVAKYSAANTRSNTNGDATLALEEVTVTGGTSTGSLSAAVITVTSGAVTLKAVAFQSLSLTGVSVFSVGATGTLTMATALESATACSFNGITSDGDAAILSHDYDSFTGSITIRNAAFTSCRGTIAGVAYIQNADENTNLVWSDLTFESCGASNTNTDPHAANVYVTIKSDAGDPLDGYTAAGAFAGNSKWNETKTGASGGDFMYSDKDSNANIDMFVAAAPATPVSLAITGEPASTNTYTTLALAVAAANDATTATTRTITLTDDLTEATVGSSVAVTVDTTLTVTASEKITLTQATTAAVITVGAIDLAAACTLTVVDLTVDLTASKTIGGSVFAIVANSSDATVTGTLDLQGVTIKSSTAGTAATSSVTVIDAAAGVLKMTACAFADITMNNKPLLTVGTGLGDLVMLKKGETVNTFTSIKRTTAAGLDSSNTSIAETSGAVFDVLISASTEVLAITNAKFDGCGIEATSGTFNGGVISIFVHDAATAAVVYADELTWTEPEDETMRSNDATINGEYVYVSTNDDFENAHYLAALIGESEEDDKFNFEKRTDSDPEDWTIPDDTNKVSLTITTNGGTVVITYATLADAVGAFASATSSTRSITLATGAPTDAEAITVSKDMTIASPSAASCSKKVSGSNVWSVSAEVSVAGITFQIENYDVKSEATLRSNTAAASKISAPVFTVSTGGDLTLSSVAFTMATFDTTTYEAADLAYEVIKATAGSVSLTSVNFIRTNMGTGKSLIDATAATLTLATCAFSDITLANKPLLAVGTAKDKFAITTTTTFSKITRTEGNGAVFEATVEKDGELAIAKAEFSECKCTKGYGGAAYLEVKKDASLSVTEVKFTKCESHYSTETALARTNPETDTGMGGGLCIYLTGAPKADGFVLSDITFAECAAGANGNALAIGAADKDYIAEDAPIWNSVKKITSDKDDDMVVAVVEVDTTTGTVTVKEGTAVKLSERADIAVSDDEEEEKKKGNDGDGDDGFPAWAIVIIIVGAVLIIAVVVIVIILVLRKKKTGASDEEEGKSMEQVEVSSDE